MKNILQKIKYSFACITLLISVNFTYAEVNDVTIEEKIKKTEFIYLTVFDCIQSNQNLPDLDAKISLEIEHSMDANAYSSQGKVVITEGLLKLTDSDNFIAFVVSHEIAHHLHKHLDKQRRFTPGENFEDYVAFFLQRGITMEVEADRLGLQIMQNCGFSTKGVKDFLGILLNDHSLNGKNNTAGLLYLERMKHIDADGAKLK